MECNEDGLGKNDMFHDEADVLVMLCEKSGWSFEVSAMRVFPDAFYSLLLPWGPNSFGQGIFEGKLFQYFPLLISGWINPLFLIAAVLGFLGRHERSFAALRIVVVLMIPFCWVVFYYEDLYAREGHFVWILGMLLVLFSREIAERLRA